MILPIPLVRSMGDLARPAALQEEQEMAMQGRWATLHGLQDHEKIRTREMNKGRARSMGGLAWPAALQEQECTGPSKGNE